MLLMGAAEKDRYESPEMRFRDRRGREHYNNGRYAPRGGLEYNREPWSVDYDPYDSMDPYGNHFEIGTNATQYRENELRSPEMRYGTNYGSRVNSTDRNEYNRPVDTYDTYMSTQEMRPIGFGSDYDRSKSRNVIPIRPEYTAEGMPEHLTKQRAQEWVSGMKNSDGTNGGHWTMDQTKQVMKQRGIDCNEADFYAIMNAVYSDYSKVAKKYGLDNVDFYADIAKAWLEDDDAEDGKAVRYFGSIVKKH